MQSQQQQQHHVELFEALEAYVAKACEDRDASHGLAHMTLVTVKSVALLLMAYAQSGAEISEAVLHNESAPGEGDVVEYSPLGVTKLILTKAYEIGDGQASSPDSSLAQHIRAFNSRFLSKDTPEKGNDVMPVINALYEALLTTHESKGDNNTTLAVSAEKCWARFVTVYVTAAQLFNDPTDLSTLKKFVSLCDENAGSETESAICSFPAQSLCDALNDLEKLQNTKHLVSSEAVYEHMKSDTSNHDAKDSSSPLSAPPLPLSASLFRTSLARVLVIGMLHDVNDHKYEKPDGSLSKGLEAFVKNFLCRGNGEESDGDSKNFSSLLFPNSSTSTTAMQSVDDAEVIMKAISAISYSKEKKQGMRYFVDSLVPQWTFVRDICSDADKLEAIGRAGLYRCWSFSIEMKEQKLGGAEYVHKELFADESAKEAFRQQIFKEVQNHTAEKLGILKDEFMVTVSGKRIAAAEHDEMLLLLEEWRRCGPPRIWSSSKTNLHLNH